MLSPEEAGLTVTKALDFFVVSAALVAVTVTDELLVTFGAVNTPLVEIAPELADHVTAVLLVPCTVAANCLVLPEVKLVLEGEIDRVTPVVTFTEAVAFLVLSAALVAVTVTVVPLLTVGAVNNPLLDTKPALALQVTLVLVVPSTFAEN